MSNRTSNATVVIDIQGKADQLQNLIKNIRQQFNQFDVNPNAGKNLNNILNNLEKEITNIKEKTNNNNLSIINEKEFKNSLNNIKSLYDSLVEKIGNDSFLGKQLKNDKNAILELTKAQEAYNKELQDTNKEEKKLKSNLQRLKNKQLKEENKQKISDVEYNKRETIASLAKKELNVARKNHEEKINAANERIANSNGKYTNIESKGFGSTKEGKALTQATKEYLEAEKKYKIAKAELEKYTTDDKIKNEGPKLAQDIEQAKIKLQQFQNTQKVTEQNSAFTKIKEDLLKIKNIDWSGFGIDINKLQNLNDLENALDKISNSAGENASKAFDTLKSSIDNAKQPFDDFEKEGNDAVKTLDNLMSKEQEFNQLTQSIGQFFSISNSIQLFKRAVRSAIDTVKELDAAMAEMAVVTDFTIGDMWKQLPQYTQRANNLGLTIKDVYESMALFYQQGLNTNEAVALSNSTLKMARIAGLDAAEATNRKLKSYAA